MSAAITEIVDVRVNDKARNGETDIRSEILTGLARPEGQKSLPTMLLYDERGLRLYDDITTSVNEYYLFPAEEAILKNHADDIVQVIHGANEERVTEGEIVLELGAGALRKTSHILSALARHVPEGSTAAPVTYYALDLEERELKRTLTELSKSLGPELRGKVEAKGMWGTYDGGLKFIDEGGLRGRDAADHVAAPSVPRGFTTSRDRDTSPSSDSASSNTGTNATEAASVDTAPSTPGSMSAHAPLHIMFLGSSLGNFTRGADAEFLKSLPLRPGSGDTLLLGLDHGNDKEMIERAYNDAKGVTKKFIMNGLKGAGRALGDEALFDESNWEYVGQYNVQDRRHEAFYQAKSAHTIKVPQTEQEMSFAAGELVNVEVSYKYTETDAFSLFTDANLRPIQRWTDAPTGYSLWLLERPPFSFPRIRAQTASTLSTVPFGVPSFQEFQDMWAAWDFVTRKMIPDNMMFQKPIDLRHICLFYCGHIPTFLDIHLSRLLGEPHTEPEEFKYIFERGIDPIVDDPTQCHPHSEVPEKDEDWPSLPRILEFQSRVRQRLRNLYDELESGKRQLTRKIARVLFITLEHEGFHAEARSPRLASRLPLGSPSPRPWQSQALPRTPTVALGPATITLGHDDDEAEDEEPGKATDVKTHEFGWDNESPPRTVDVGEFTIEWRPVTNGDFYEFWKSGKGAGKAQFPKSWVEEGGEIKVRTLYGPIPLKIAYHWPIVTSYDNISTYASVKGGRIPTEPELRLFYDKFESGYEGGRNVAFRNWHPV
ncbi:hypothetical protein EVG20_g7851, partial [Dentipellis fragilis]